MKKCVSYIFRFETSGISLVSFVVYTGLLAIVLVAIAGFAKVTVGGSVQYRYERHVDAEGTFLMQKITQDIRNATSIVTPSEGTSSTSTFTIHTDDARDPVTYSIDNGRIFLSEAGGLPIVLSSNRVVISAFRIENVSTPGTPGILRVLVSLQADIHGQEISLYERTFQTAASLRFSL